MQKAQTAQEFDSKTLNNKNHDRSIALERSVKLVSIFRFRLALPRFNVTTPVTESI